MLTSRYVTAVLMLMLTLGMTACGQGQPAVDQIVGTSTTEPTVPAKADWSVENDAAFDYRSITSADKTQRWTCVGADRPRINITHPAAHTVATAVAGRTAGDKGTVINGELYKFAWAAWSSNPEWTPEEHALNVRHDQALQLKRALVISGAESFSVSIGNPPAVSHYSTDGLMAALTENEMECFK